MRLETVMRIAKYLLILLMIATVAFIFINSMLPPDESREQSDTIKDIVIELLPDDSAAESFVEEYIRKIAHFSEYGLLGIELALYMILFERRRLRLAPLALILALVVSFIDESIQIASGRGPAVMDMWIDVGGFATFSLLTYAAFGVVTLLIFAAGKLRKGAPKNELE